MSSSRHLSYFKSHFKASKEFQLPEPVVTIPRKLKNAPVFASPGVPGHISHGDDKFAGIVPVHGIHESDGFPAPATGYYEEHLLTQPFPIKGQGTMGLEYVATGPFRLVINSEYQLSYGNSDVLVLEVGNDTACFRTRNNSDESNILKKVTLAKPHLGYEAGLKTRYWFSIDKENKILRYGKGYETTSLTLLEVDLKLDGSTPWADWMNDVKYLAVAPSKTDDVVPFADDLEVWPFAVDEMSPVVVHNDKVTLEDLETGSVTVVENLPPACQQLYANVTGAGIKLDDNDFEFSKAIHHSVTTEGCIGWNKLKEKADASGHPFEAQYLRVTLGLNKGNSPGSPFVMEVWPPHHHSSVHSHSNAFAVIKVLHGRINSFYYAALDPTKEESQYYRQAEFHKNDVTWLSDRQLQTHQLRNMTDETCVTIQCYQYGDHDHTHYEYFDYIDEGEDGHATIKKFVPTSDWGFTDFKTKVKAEWEKFQKEERERVHEAADKGHAMFMS